MVTRVHLIVALPIGVLFTLGAGWPKTNAKVKISIIYGDGSCQ